VERAQLLYREFQFDNISMDYIHGKRTSNQTKEVVNQFRLGKLFVLICTDVMARGIDFKGVSCVINYDFPTSTYSYVHRIGRCGRAGHKGECDFKFMFLGFRMSS
jgi:ATP-dependent RNA helicase DDX52/ROK1